MSKPAPRLGKGLSALLGPRVPVPARSEPAVTAIPAAAIPNGPATTIPLAAEAKPDGGLRTIPIDEIQRNPLQPRTSFDAAALDELAASIRISGVIQPVLVRKSATGYELIAGERRWRAAKLAGLTAIPATVRQVTDSEALELALVENLQREDLNPLERATAYQQYLATFHTTADQLAEKLGESRASVSNYLRLLKLHSDVQGMLRSGELSMGHARAIAGLNDPQKQLALARLSARRNLSVRQIESLARDSTTDVEARQSAAAPSGTEKHLADVALSLSKAAGLRVEIHSGKGKNTGRVVIHYGSLDEFDRLATLLGGNAKVD